MQNLQKLKKEARELPAVQCPRHSDELATNICLQNDCPRHLQVLCGECLSEHAGHESYVQSLRKFFASVLLQGKDLIDSGEGDFEQKCTNLEIRQIVQGMQNYLTHLQTIQQQLQQSITAIRVNAQTLQELAESNSEEQNEYVAHRVSERLATIMQCMYDKKELLVEQNFQALKELFDVSYNRETRVSSLRARSNIFLTKQVESSIQNLQKQTGSIQLYADNIKKCSGDLICHLNTIVLSNKKHLFAKNVNESEESYLSQGQTLKGEVALAVRAPQVMQRLIHIEHLSRDEIILSGKSNDPILIIGSQDLALRQSIEVIKDLEIWCIYVESELSFAICLPQGQIMLFRRNSLRQPFYLAKRAKLYQNTITNIVAINLCGEVAVYASGDGIFVHKPGGLFIHPKETIFETNQKIRTKSAHAIVEHALLVSSFSQKVYVHDLKQKIFGQYARVGKLSLGQNKLYNSTLLNTSAGQDSNCVASIILAHQNGDNNGDGNVQIYQLIKNYTNSCVSFTLIQDIKDPLGAGNKYVADVIWISDTQFMMPGIAIDGIQIWQKNKESLLNQQLEKISQKIYEKNKELLDDGPGYFDIAGAMLGREGKFLIVYGSSQNHRLYKII